jgi:uncharacterized protein with GYD domain
MPKYLFISSLTQEGLRGTLSEGGTARRDAIRRATEGLGGTLEAYYYAFGDRDVYTIVDLPDNATAAAASTAVSAGGAAKVTTVVLITPEEMDEVGKKNVQAYVRRPQADDHRSGRAAPNLPTAGCGRAAVSLPQAAVAQNINSCALRRPARQTHHRRA